MGSASAPGGGEGRAARRVREKARHRASRLPLHLPVHRPFDPARGNRPARGVALIFVDSDIPMFLVGTTNRFKIDAQRWLEISITAGDPLVTDAWVLQEILHRYVAIECREAIQPCLDVLLGVVSEVLPVDAADVEKAKAIVFGHPRLAARTALHLAVMERHGVDRVMSFDTGFDTFPGLERLHY